MTSAVKPSGKRKPVVFVLLVIGFLAVCVLFFLRPTQNLVLPELSRNDLVFRDGHLYRTNESVPFTGFMTESYPNGVRKAKSGVFNGLIHGVSEGWHTNGVMEVREHFTNGVSHGLREKWYDSGKKLSEVNIVAGKLDGRFRRWYETGELAEQIEMKQGEPDGIARSYFPSGFLKSEAHLDHGKAIETKFWNDGEQKPSASESK